jgi:hypothetical protein
MDNILDLGLFEIELVAVFRGASFKPPLIKLIA